MNKQQKNVQQANKVRCNMVHVDEIMDLLMCHIESNFKYPSFWHKTYQLMYIYSIFPGDGLQICPKHIEVD